MKINKVLYVMMEGHKVGTLAKTVDHLVAFEYDKTWLQDGFSISPISLPLQKGVFIPKHYDPFEGLFGVFSDSLPDGWGRLLVDRLLLSHGMRSDQVDALNRLAIVGNSGMGALSYEPETNFETGYTSLSLDEIAQECFG